MGVGTSPSREWQLWAVTFVLLIGSLLLVHPVVRIVPPLPDPVLRVDLTVIGVLAFLIVPVLLFLVFGPYADWQRSWRRPFGIAIGLVGLVLAVTAVLAGAHLVGPAFVVIASLFLIWWFLTDVIYRPPKDPKERDNEGWKCDSVGVGGWRCTKDGEVWICDKGFGDCVDVTPH
jgi:hypothetical protein